MGMKKAKALSCNNGTRGMELTVIINMMRYSVYLGALLVFHTLFSLDINVNTPMNCTCWNLKFQISFKNFTIHKDPFWRIYYMFLYGYWLIEWLYAFSWSYLVTSYLKIIEFICYFICCTVYLTFTLWDECSFLVGCSTFSGRTTLSLLEIDVELLWGLHKFFVRAPRKLFL